MIAALGGVFVERALEEVQGGVDLALELFPAEPENFVLLAHKYAYNYAYIRACYHPRVSVLTIDTFCVFVSIVRTDTCTPAPALHRLNTWRFSGIR
jgi:hypothetical protein